MSATGYHTRVSVTCCHGDEPDVWLAGPRPETTSLASFRVFLVLDKRLDEQTHTGASLSIALTPRLSLLVLLLLALPPPPPPLSHCFVWFPVIFFSMISLSACLIM